MNTKRIGTWLLWLAGFAALSFFYGQVFDFQPVNSDTANALLAAQDMAAGNWRLNGWFMAPDNYLGLDELVYAFVWALTGKVALTLRLVPALQWAGLMALATYLGTRPRLSFQSLAILAAILFIPIFGPITEHFYFRAAFHVPTVCFMLLTVMLSDMLLTVARRRWLWEGLLAIVTIDAAFSDPFFQFIITAPLLIALRFSASPRRMRIVIIFLLSIFCSMVLMRLNIATGGFTQPLSNVPPPLALNDVSLTIHNFLLVWLGILGCFPVGQPLVPMLLAVLRLPLVLLLLLPAWRCTHRFRMLEFTDMCLLLIVVTNVGAMFATSALHDYTAQRYLLPAWIALAILAAKFTRRYVAITGYCLGIAAFAFAICLVKLAHTPVEDPYLAAGETDYITALAARSLTRGYAAYWQAGVTTLSTDGKIKIAALLPGKDGRLIAYDWFARQDWYSGNPAGKNFFISIPMIPRWPTAEVIAIDFGKPDSTFITHNAAIDYSNHTADVITYVYNRPLPAMTP